MGRSGRTGSHGATAGIHNTIVIKFVEVEEVETRVYKYDEKLFPSVRVPCNPGRCGAVAEREWSDPGRASPTSMRKTWHKSRQTRITKSLLWKVEQASYSRLCIPVIAGKAGWD